MCCTHYSKGADSRVMFEPNNISKDMSFDSCQNKAAYIYRAYSETKALFPGFPIVEVEVLNKK